MMIMMKGSAEHLAEHNTLGVGARAKELSLLFSSLSLTRLTDALCSKRALFSLFQMRISHNACIFWQPGIFLPPLAQFCNQAERFRLYAEALLWSESWRRMHFPVVKSVE
jgi:hypothetical protein